MNRALLVLAVLLTACGRISFDPNDLSADPDLIAYWPLDEAAGAARFVDRSPLANHGDCTVCPTAGIPGVRGNAIDIGVASAGIHITAGPKLATWTGPLTLAAWVRVAANNEYGVILSNDRDCCGPYEGYSLWASHYSSGPAINIWSGGSPIVARGSPLPLGVWTHIVGTTDGQISRIFVDGVELTTGAVTPAVLPFSYEPWIGALAYSAPNFHFQGSIDEVLVIGRALDAADVATLFESYRAP